MRLGIHWVYWANKPNLVRTSPYFENILVLSWHIFHLVLEIETTKGKGHTVQLYGTYYEPTTQSWSQLSTMNNELMSSAKLLRTIRFMPVRVHETEQQCTSSTTAVLLLIYQCSAVESPLISIIIYSHTASSKNEHLSSLHQDDFLLVIVRLT